VSGLPVAPKAYGLNEVCTVELDIEHEAKTMDASLIILKTPSTRVLSRPNLRALSLKIRRIMGQCAGLSSHEKR
jgi:hypothetical protein